MKIFIDGLFGIMSLIAMLTTQAINVYVLFVAVLVLIFSLLQFWSFRNIYRS
ncbi:MAG TPA: hypothetical protein VKA26_15320 [Ignavibacteriaceae bacterium]|nr:hypothetical protein [Ignavibacteriaceae bacterium]